MARIEKDFGRRFLFDFFRKSFEAGEEIYTAFEEGKQGSCIICGNCTK